jgi:hypothetical protein
VGFLEFKNNRSGNSEAFKFIKQLHDERRKHPFYTNLTKIIKVDKELKYATRSKKTD